MSAAPLLHRIIANERIYVAQNIQGSLDKVFHCFSADDVLDYEPVRNEFGPLRLSSLIRFVEMLESQIAAHPKQKIVCYVGQDKRKLTSACYLLGAYMILKHDYSASLVSDSFRWLDANLIEPFRGASLEDSCDAELSLADCWRAIQRAKALAWLQLRVLLRLIAS